MKAYTSSLLILFLLAFSATCAMAMNKAELIDAVSEGSVGLSKADAKRALEAFISITSKALKKGDRVSLIGFGTFSISKRAARTGRNKDSKKSSAKNVVKFKAGADLSKKVNRALRDNIFHELQSSAQQRSEIQTAVSAIVRPSAVVGEVTEIKKTIEQVEEDAVTSALIVELEEEEGLRRALAATFLDAFRVVVSDVLSRKEPVEIDGFGVFSTGTTGEVGELIACFEADVKFGFEIILGLHEQVQNRMLREAEYLGELTTIIVKEVGKREQATALNRPSYKNFFASGEELRLLGEEYGDADLLKRIGLANKLIAGLNEPFALFFEKDNKDAGTRVRKGMQELKNISQDIRKDIRSIRASMRSKLR